MLLFFIVLTLGFIFELGKKALDTPSRQCTTNDKSLYISMGFFFRLSSCILLMVQIDYQETKNI